MNVTPDLLQSGLRRYKIDCPGILPEQASGPVLEEITGG